MPLSVDEYLIGQNWAVNEQSRLETGGGEGVEIVKNEPFDFQACLNAGGGGDQAFLNGKYNKGQYTKKIYKLSSKVPKYIRALFTPVIGAEGFNFHEEAWNAYPYCKTVITNPGYMKDNYKVVVESMHLPDRGDCLNALEIDNAAGKIPATAVQILDVSSAKSHILKDPSFPEPSEFVAKLEAGSRGPLGGKGWTSSQDLPIMTCYKRVSVHCKWGIFQNKLENFIMDQYRDVLLAFHQKIWLWIERWSHLSLDDVRELEDQTQNELLERIKDSERRGDL